MAGDDWDSSSGSTGSTNAVRHDSRKRVVGISQRRRGRASDVPRRLPRTSASRAGRNSAWPRPWPATRTASRCSDRAFRPSGAPWVGRRNWMGKECTCPILTSGGRSKCELPHARIGQRPVGRTVGEHVSFWPDSAVVDTRQDGSYWGISCWAPSSRRHSSRISSGATRQGQARPGSSRNRHSRRSQGAMLCGPLCGGGDAARASTARTC
jgi:hypothetical protein